jgi:hypothetical protein
MSAAEVHDEAARFWEPRGKLQKAARERHLARGNREGAELDRSSALDTARPAR